VKLKVPRLPVAGQNIADLWVLANPLFAFMSNLLLSFCCAFAVPKGTAKTE
jgi:hypothetical protein